MDDGTGSVRGLSASSRTERTCVIAAPSGEPGVAGNPGPVSEAIRAAKTRVERDIATPGVGELLTAYYDPARGFAGETFDTLGANRRNEITLDDPPARGDSPRRALVAFSGPAAARTGRGTGHCPAPP